MDIFFTNILLLELLERKLGKINIKIAIKAAAGTNSSKFIFIFF